jgi:selenocysteine lyase/cysteine desulfurase
MPIYYPDDSWYVQMASAPLPLAVDVAKLQTRLYDEYRVEVPVHAWNERRLIRLSLQAYNDRQDVDRLLHGLRQLI